MPAAAIDENRTAAGMPPSGYCSAQALQRRAEAGPRQLDAEVSQPAFETGCQPADLLQCAALFTQNHRKDVSPYCGETAAHDAARARHLRHASATCVSSPAGGLVERNRTEKIEAN